MIEALVFDAYGTLFDVHSVIARCEELWPGRGAALSQLWRARQLEYTWQRSLMRRYAPFSQVTGEALAYACAALGLPLAEDAASALMNEYLVLKTFPEAETTLSNLKVRKAILTNGSPDMVEPLVKQSRLKLDAVISVDELKVFKPAPEVYALAVERLKTKRIGFVSSNCWDALGAKSFGFTVYWINRGGAPLDRMGLRPDHVVKSLDEILL